MIELLREENGCLGVLSGAMTIYDVAELKSQIDEYWHQDESLALDLAGVSEIDTAGVQLLLALRQAAGKGMTLKRHSPSVIEIFDLYQLAPLFGDVIVLTDH
jgi:ABC-type transporter Mla MlaB component